MVQCHKELRVWKTGMDLAVAVYKATNLYPKSELFGLVSQMRRAATSVPANIAEGFSRQHKPEFIQFLHISKGSLSELETYIDLSQRLGYLDPIATSELTEQVEATGKMLRGLLSSLKRGNNQTQQYEARSTKHEAHE